MQTKGLEVTPALAIAILFLSLVSCASMRRDYFLFQSRTDEVRESVQNMASDTLTPNRLSVPGNRNEAKNAAGYAAFNGFG
jgi:hypothetical protein